MNLIDIIDGSDFFIKKLYPNGISDFFIEQLYFHDCSNQNRVEFNLYCLNRPSIYIERWGKWRKDFNSIKIIFTTVPSWELEMINFQKNYYELCNYSIKKFNNTDPNRFYSGPDENGNYREIIYKEYYQVIFSGKEWSIKFEIPPFFCQKPKPYKLDEEIIKIINKSKE